MIEGSVKSAYIAFSHAWKSFVSTKYYWNKTFLAAEPLKFRSATRIETLIPLPGIRKSGGVLRYPSLISNLKEKQINYKPVDNLIIDY